MSHIVDIPPAESTMEEDRRRWFAWKTGGRTIVKTAPVKIWDGGTRVVDNDGTIWTIYKNQFKRHLHPYLAWFFSDWTLTKGVGGNLSHITTEAELERYLEEKGETP